MYHQHPALFKALHDDCTGRLRSLQLPEVRAALDAQRWGRGRRRTGSLRDR